jgi:hypothetical protein
MTETRRIRRLQVKLPLIHLCAGLVLLSNTRSVSALEPPAIGAAIHQWVKDLNDERFGVREKATRNLLKEGKTALSVIAEEADWKNIEVVRRTLGILEKLSHSTDTETACAAAAVLDKLAAKAGLAAAGARSALGDRWLSPEDERFLKSMLQEFLFDPQGGERVRAVMTTAWSREETRLARLGWLRKDETGERIYFSDGESIAAPGREKITNINYLDWCRKVYGHEHAVLAKRREIDARQEPDFLVVCGEPSPLVHAAWLYRLGHRMLAAKSSRPFPTKVLN